MISVEDKIVARIKRYGRGCVITNRDFLDLSKSGTVDWCLHCLTDKGIIRPVIRGIYYYPQYSVFLQEELAPSLENIAQALARKNQWHIQISGDAALNFLGLSTQIPMKTVYFSDGPSRTFNIENRILEFKHIMLREAKIASPISEIVVQALRHLGESHISNEVIMTIKNKLSDKDCKTLIKDTQFVRGWIRDIIMKICNKEEINGQNSKIISKGTRGIVSADFR